MNRHVNTIAGRFSEYLGNRTQSGFLLWRIRHNKKSGGTEQPQAQRAEMIYARVAVGKSTRSAVERIEADAMLFSEKEFMPLLPLVERHGFRGGRAGERGEIKK